MNPEVRPHPSGGYSVVRVGDIHIAVNHTRKQAHIDAAAYTTDQLLHLDEAIHTALDMLNPTGQP